MKMSQLLRYDLPPEVVALWQAREGETLLPLQEQAVKRYDLFGTGNLLVQAPTSSGKTFIGEMAAIHTALRRKRVVYLVPLKALAEEKYLDFKEKYTGYGLKVVISTRDHREFDAEFERGDFSIAVVVYEKLSQMLVRRVEGLAEIALIIADELELLSDPERGAMTELLLTRILHGGEDGCRMIGLSAVIGEASRLAGWMDARLLYYERRPVELRYGVLHEGQFRYRTYNELGEGEEILAGAQSESSWDALTQNVCLLAGRGEACLIFVKAKHESRRGAELLAQRVDLPAAEEAIEALRACEATRARECLMNTLNHGVAFHNADLAPEERQIAEEAFRSGAARVMVSTSTLAVGLNLPARNVFLSAEKWHYDKRLDVPWKTPILRTEYENMGGRAGRYGAGHDFGRSILVASTPFDQETLWRRYVEGERERIEPRLAKEPLEDHVLRLVASRFCRDRDSITQFLESTLTGRWVWAELYPLDEVEFRIQAAVSRCVTAGVLNAADDGRLEATPLGLAAAAKGVDIATARELAHWLGASEDREWRPLDLLFAAASAPSGRMPQVMLTAREYEHADYTGRMKQAMRGEELCADVPINRIRNCNLRPFFEEVRAIKIALFLDEWIEHTPLCGIEESYNTMAGQILSAADQASWVIDAAAAIAKALGAPEILVNRVACLAERVQHGLVEEALPLARLGLAAGRGRLLGLVAQGLHRPEAVRETPLAVLGQWVSNADARVLHAWAAQSAPDAPAAPAEIPAPSRPILLVDSGRPGEILLDGVAIPLQEKQYRLIRVLAENPGVCVPYDDLYRVLWGEEVVVGDSQLHLQKRKLLKRIRDARPERGGIISTNAKHGLTLHLDAEDILYKAPPITNAA